MTRIYFIFISKTHLIIQLMSKLKYWLWKIWTDIHLQNWQPIESLELESVNVMMNAMKVNVCIYPNWQRNGRGDPNFLNMSLIYIYCHIVFIFSQQLTTNQHCELGFQFEVYQNSKYIILLYHLRGYILVSEEYLFWSRHHFRVRDGIMDTEDQGIAS